MERNCSIASLCVTITGLGLFGAVPLLHGCYVHFDAWHVRWATLGEVVMGATYLVRF